MDSMPLWVVLLCKILWRGVAVIATYTGSGLDFDHYDLVKHKWKANLSYISSLHFLHYLLAQKKTNFL